MYKLDILMKNNIIIKIFSSIRTAIILFVIIGVSCAAGTLIPQLKDYAFYQKNFPRSVNYIYHFSLNDVYHSGWFIALMLMLALNVAVCTIRRFRADMKAAKHVYIEAGDVFVSNLKNISVFDAERPRELIIETARETISKAGYKYYFSESAGRKYCHGEKGAYSFMGEFTVHVSLLMIIAGALIGNLYAFKKPVECYPGDIVAVPAEKYLVLQKQIDMLAERSVVTRKDASREIAELKISQRAVPRKSFEFKIDDFRTEYIKTEATDEVFIKNWYTTISALDGTVPVYTRTISVNDPFYYRGINVYQMTHGKGPGGFYDFKFTINDNGRSFYISIPSAGYEVSVKDAGLTLKLLRFEPDLTIDLKSDGTREYYSSSRTPDNPAAELEISRGPAGSKTILWVLIKSPAPETAVEGVSGVQISFTNFGIKTVEFTGLQIAYNPGAGLVLCGSILMIAGFFIAFNFYHRRLWIVVDELKKAVTVCGASNKNQMRFAEEFEQICASLGSKISDKR